MNEEAPLTAPLWTRGAFTCRERSALVRACPRSSASFTRSVGPTRAAVAEQWRCVLRYARRRIPPAPILMRRLVAALAIVLVARSASAQAPPAWTRGATCYEVFVRSFQDSDGDGIGDLKGLISRLDYINDGSATKQQDLGAR